MLPARFPNLLVNGSTGIAVGMATNIPPHNLTEVIDAVIDVLEDDELMSDKAKMLKVVMKHIKGPDFPTGALIVGRQGINDAYTTGKGSIKMRAVCEIEEGPKGNPRIVVTELPYQVNKARLAAKIAELAMAKEERLEGIADLRDESSRDGIRLVIDLKKNAVPQVVLNTLYKRTQLQDNFGVNMLAIVDGVPRTLNLADVIEVYIDHQIDVVVRRTQVPLAQSRGAVAHPRGTDHRSRQHRRDRRSDPRCRERRGGAQRLDGALRADRDPGAAHPRHAAAPTDRARAGQDPRGVHRACRRRSRN